MATGTGGGRGMSLLLTLEQGPARPGGAPGPARRGRTGDRPQCGSRLADRRSRHVRFARALQDQRAGRTDISSPTRRAAACSSTIPEARWAPGNSARLRNGMRLRLGDYVLWVEVQGADAPPAADRTEAPAQTGASRAAAVFGHDDFFSVQTEEEPAPPRPADLPDPFEKPAPGAFQGFERADADRHFAGIRRPVQPRTDRDARRRVRQRQPAADDLGNDPFGFDAPIAAPSIAAEEPVSQPAFGFDIGFDTGPLVAEPQSPAPLARQPQPTLPPPPLNDVAEFAPWELPATPQEPPAPARPVEPAPLPRPAGQRRPRRSPRPSSRSLRRSLSPRATCRRSDGRVPCRAQRICCSPGRTNFPGLRRSRAEDAELRAAFLRGLGVAETSSGDGDAAAEMEKFGREYRLMMEGLMQLLRKRAEEKGNARVAQTVVGASEVNPLKFLPTVDDALATILCRAQPRLPRRRAGDRRHRARPRAASRSRLARRAGGACGG